MSVKPVLLRQLNIDSAVHKTIAIVGAGGKTSLMKRLRDELISQGLKVILTTSTHILYEEPETFVRVSRTSEVRASAAASDAARNVKPESVICYKYLSDPDAGFNTDRVRDIIARYGYAVVGCIDDDACAGHSKISSPGESIFKLLKGLCDVVLIEADGARGRMIKIPAAWEPVIPAQTDLVIAVAGAGAIGQRIMDAAYMPEDFARFVGKDSADRISCDDVAVIASSEEALRKNVGETAFRFYLNAVDNIYDIDCHHNSVINAVNAYAAEPADIMKLINRLGCGHNIEASCGSIRNADSVGAVVLAAGLGTRFGGDKLKSVIGGKPMFMHVLYEMARIFGYEQITFVTGSSDIAYAASQTGAHVVINPDPQNGISSSMKLGLAANLHMGSCLFAVADQPFIRSESICGLLEGYKRSDKYMAAMTDSRGELSNPCIFASCYYRELFGLSGDRGGKAVMRRHSEDVYPHTARSDAELFDIDTAEDMERFIIKTEGHHEEKGDSGER